MQQWPNWWLAQLVIGLTANWTKWWWTKCQWPKWHWTKWVWTKWWQTKCILNKFLNCTPWKWNALPLFETNFRSWCILKLSMVMCRQKVICHALDSWYLLWCLPSSIPSLMWEIHAMSGTCALIAKQPKDSVQYFYSYLLKLLCTDSNCQYQRWRQSNYTAKSHDIPLEWLNFWYRATLFCFNTSNNSNFIHSKITMAGDVVPYYTVTALVPTLK